jgi:hypothetical protein
MGVTPFRKSGAEIRNRAGDAIVGDLRYDVWRQASIAGAGGEVDLWEGVCEGRARSELIGRGNRVLVADGISFRVEDAIYHDVLDYVELTLRDPRAQG